MATRNPNRTQVDIPFSSVPIVSPTVTAGRGAVVGPAQVQPSKLVSLSNALGVATDIIPTVTAIKGLEKQQGLRAGELAAKAEIDAKDAFSKMEQAGRKAVEAGTLKESQLPSFQFAFKDGIAKRAAGDYNSLLVSQLKRVNENLENGRNGAEYAQELTTEAYEQFAERFNNDPIMLQSFNTAIQGYNRNFSEQVIRARDKALKDNHIKNETNAYTNLFQDVFLNQEMYPDDTVIRTFSTGIAGLTEAESTRVLMNSVNSAFYNLTEGKPTERKFEQARELLDNVASSRTQSGIPIQNLEKEGELYHILRARLNRYKDLVENVGEEESKKVGRIYTNEFQVHVGNYMGQPTEENKALIKSSLVSMLGSITDDEFEEVVSGLKTGNADGVILGLIKNATDLTEAEVDTLAEANTGLDNFINQNRALPFTSNEEILEKGYDRAYQLGASGQDFSTTAVYDAMGYQMDQTQLIIANQRYNAGKKTIMGTHVGGDRETRSGIAFRIDDMSERVSSIISSDPRVSLLKLQTGIISKRYAETSNQRREINDEYILKVDKTIQQQVADFEGEPTVEDLKNIRREAFREHQPWLVNQYETVQEEIIQRLVEPAQVNTQFIINKYDDLGDISGSVGAIKYRDREQNKNVKTFLKDTSRDYMLRVTNQIEGEARYRQFNFTDDQVKEIRKVIGWESPANVPKGTEAGNIDWRNVLLFSKAAWEGEDSIWNYDNPDSVLRLAKSQFESLEGLAPDKNKTPHAYFWTNTYGIRNAAMFNDMLQTQQILFEAYNIYEETNNLKDLQKENELAEIEKQQRELQAKERGGIFAPPTKDINLSESIKELERRSKGLDGVYNRSVEYYLPYNK